MMSVRCEEVQGDLRSCSSLSDCRACWGLLRGSVDSNRWVKRGVCSFKKVEWTEERHLDGFEDSVNKAIGSKVRELSSL